MNNKTFYRMDFGAVKLAMLIIVLIGVLALTGLDIAMLAGAINTVSPAAAGVSLGAAVIVGAATLVIIFNSGYRIKEDRVEVCLGFFKDKVMFSAITSVKINAKTGELYLVTGDEVSGTSVKINAERKSLAAFESALRPLLQTVPFDTFEPSDTKEQ